MITNAKFRKMLNAAFPLNREDVGRGATGRYKATKRAYGDYLFATDREQFLEDKRQYDAGHLPNLEKFANA